MPIRHRDTGRVKRKVREIIKNYMGAQMEGALDRALKNYPYIDPDKPNVEDLAKDLLALRKELASAIKRGMLQRKDGELEIIILALLVATYRLAVDRKSDPDYERY